ncbi:increased DNA methylation 1-like isoform X2 [Senna tora]|uniref:Increased DNA methylation 1-like isoform X2 n=1 Tax=Senna tora TaxID=362788 RepID=A0A834TBQ5_9FABA|nr:increased DNA methylation 1-like isoform X2 [Senna tora]
MSSVHVSENASGVVVKALKPKVESSVKAETAQEAAQTANTEPDGKLNAALSALTTSRNKIGTKNVQEAYYCQGTFRYWLLVCGVLLRMEESCARAVCAMDAGCYAIVLLTQRFLRHFPSSCVERVGPLCKTCVESKEFEESSIDPTAKRVRSPRPVAVSKPPSDLELCNLSQINRHWKKRTRTSKWVSSSKSSESVSEPILLRKKNMWRMKKKDQRLHKLVFEEGGLPDGTEVAYYGRGQVTKWALEYFVGAATLRSALHNLRSMQAVLLARNPSRVLKHFHESAMFLSSYAYIYTSNGVSLHELAISLSKGRKYSAKDNDDLCIICWDGGNLLLCDGCPRAFHKDCASLSSIPRGDWYCKFCQNMFQREKFVEHNANAVAAGRVEGVDPIEQITKRCIRIVKDIEAELSGCALCSRSGFGPRTIILCDQCEKEFHVGCLRDHKMAYLKELPEGKWFCCLDCNRIHSTLQKFLVWGAERLPDYLLDIIKMKQEEKGLEFINDIDVRWRLLNAKISSPETRPLLSEAISIFHECFDPIVDSTTGRDLIPAMVYGRNVRSQEFGGMYCAILTVNSSVVSAAMLRIFGRDVAELPLVATSNGNHGKCIDFTVCVDPNRDTSKLFACIERLLVFLNVKNLVLPAAEEAESIWTDKFGFNKMNPEQISTYRKKCCQMVTFKGTSMLQKMVESST